MRAHGRRVVRGLTIGTLATLAAVAAVIADNSGVTHRMSNAIRPMLDRAARLAGFGIDTVVLTGHRLTADSDIYDALDLTNATSLVSLDTESVRRRLERLPWVASAEITRVFPDRLDVRITERNAFAVWKRGDQEFLIDPSGRVLSPVAAGASYDLPRFAGEGAASEAFALRRLLARYPELQRRVELAERIEGRRWSLQLRTGITVQLPADGESTALDAMATDGALARLTAAGNRIIDLRTPGRIAVRQAIEAAAAAQASKSGS
jgi:cell division protein FtsQ